MSDQYITSFFYKKYAHQKNKPTTMVKKYSKNSVKSLHKTERTVDLITFQLLTAEGTFEGACLISVFRGKI